MANSIGQKLKQMTSITGLMIWTVDMGAVIDKQEKYNEQWREI
jgi:hypothetical protein